MQLRRVLSAVFIVAMVAGCSTPAATTAPTAAPATAAPATPAPATPAPATPAPATPAPATPAPATPAPATPAPATPAPSVHPEAVIDGVEAGAEISIWTFYLSPTFDGYIQDTIARFQEAYPGVKVNWEDHQATFLDDYRNAFAAGNAPDVANLSDTEGWVREFASKGLLLSMTDNLPQSVIDSYYPGLFNQQLVEGKSYQVPWYQAIAIELINTQVYTGTPQGTDPETYAGGAGLKVEDFPKSFDGIPALCQTIVDTTGKLCNMRLTVNNLLADMVYQGGVKVIGDDGKFAFNSADGVAWLQMYVDLVAKGLVDKEALITADDRIALDKFIQG